MKIMVTGATGGYGSYAVDFVREFAPNAELSGLVRNEAKAKTLDAKGVIARIGDYTNPDSLVKAFDGIERLLFVSISQYEIQKNVVAAAKISNLSSMRWLNGARSTCPNASKTQVKLL